MALLSPHRPPERLREAASGAASRLAATLREVGELIFPPRCQVCQMFSRWPICDNCARSFDVITPPACVDCGKPFDPAAVPAPRCGACASGRHYVQAVRSFGLHVGRLRDAVNSLKFRGRLRLVEPLGKRLVHVLDESSPFPLRPCGPLTGIVPVPLHPARRRERGFDQAELLASVVSRHVRIPMWPRLLMRTRYTQPQVGLNPAERRQNVRGAFRLRYPITLTGMRLLLIDDVYTTGSTLDECARVLRQGGAEAVYAVTVSRAAPEWHPHADLFDGP